jgi:putative transposase
MGNRMMRTAQSISFRSEMIDQLIEGRSTRTRFEHDGVLDKLWAALSEGRARLALGDDRANAADTTPDRGVATPTTAEVARLKLRHPDTPARIVSLYARGYAPDDIQCRASLLLGEPVSLAAVEALLAEVRREAEDWRGRSLEPSYPVVVFERVHVKGGTGRAARNRYCHFAIGFQAHGPKEVLGIWLEEKDDARFWASVLDSLKDRGVDDVIYMLGTGAPVAHACARAFPHSIGVAHVGDQVRQSLELVTSKDRSAVAKALRAICEAATEGEAESNLEGFDAGPLGRKYRAIGQIWRNHWNALAAFFDIPVEVRRVVTSTHAADQLRRDFKKCLRGHGPSSSIEDATTLMYLAARTTLGKWKRPQREWHSAKTQLAMLFPERFS